MNKVALVTGGSRGIGKAICYALAEKGYHVIVHYNNSKKSAEKIAKDINGTAIGFNFSNFKKLDSFIGKITEKFSSLDCIVHNAGIAELDNLNSINENFLDQQLDINLKMPVFLTQKLYKHMSEGSIIFISSGCASSPTPDALAYAMSKAGIEIFAKSIFQQLAPDIRVNIVVAGTTDTDMYNKNYTDKDKEWVRQNNPMGCPRTPQEIANTVAFLVSEEASGITGQTIRVNGGSHV